MNYLIYIEHAAENLQFYLWYRDYLKRFYELPKREQDLAPQWTAQMLDATTTAAQAEKNAASKLDVNAPDMFKDTAKGRESVSRSDYGWDNDSTPTLNRAAKVNYRKLAAAAYAAADVKVEPCTHPRLASPCLPSLTTPQSLSSRSARRSPASSPPTSRSMPRGS
jgi:hypothetical protein